jgi:Na+-driven multidrug efflux pump
MGTPELAATKVIIDLILVGILPGIGFGLAAASLAGQALGRGEPDDAKRWGWDVVKIAMGVVALLSVPAVLFPELILSGFIHDAQTLALAKNPLRVAAGFLFIDSVGMVLMNALTGAGDTKRVMYIAVSFQWLLFLPLVYLLGPIFGFGLVVIFAVQAAYRGLQAATFMSMWQRGRWQTIDLH